MFTEYRQNINKRDISLMKLFWEKMDGVYVTYLADADKENKLAVLVGRLWWKTDSTS